MVDQLDNFTDDSRMCVGRDIRKITEESIRIGAATSAAASSTSFPLNFSGLAPKSVPLETTHELDTDKAAHVNSMEESSRETTTGTTASPIEPGSAQVVLKSPMRGQSSQTHVYSRRCRRLVPPPPICKEGLIALSSFPIHSSYIIKEKVGQGTWGSVHVALERTSGFERAVKKIPKRFTNELARFRQEITFLKSLDHPNIVRLYETFEDYANIYMVMEYCRGGELFDRVTKCSYFSEGTAARLAHQILSSVHYIHCKNIAHRDLKPENFLFLSHRENSPMKLIDFGLAKRFSSRRQLRTKVGTLYYVSPQVLKGTYDEKCDVWSAGVILHLLLSGTPPFNGPTDACIINQIREGEVQFSAKTWKRVSPMAKELVQLMLHKDPEKRPSADQALAHPWFRLFSPSALTEIYLPRPISMPACLHGLACCSVGNNTQYGSVVDMTEFADSLPRIQCSAALPNLASTIPTSAMLSGPATTGKVLNCHANMTNMKNDPQHYTVNSSSSSLSVTTPTQNFPFSHLLMPTDIQQHQQIQGPHSANAGNNANAPTRNSGCCELSVLGVHSPLCFSRTRVDPSSSMPHQCNTPGHRLLAPHFVQFNNDVMLPAISPSMMAGKRCDSCSHYQTLSHSEVIRSQTPTQEPCLYQMNTALNEENIQVWKNLARRLVPRWRRFAMHNQLKRAALHVIAQQMHDEEIQSLRSLFLALDSKNDGALSNDELTTGMEVLSRTKNIGTASCRHDLYSNIVPSCCITFEVPETVPEKSCCCPSHDSHLSCSCRSYNSQQQQQQHHHHHHHHHCGRHSVDVVVHNQDCHFYSDNNNNNNHLPLCRENSSPSLITKKVNDNSSNDTGVSRAAATCSCQQVASMQCIMMPSHQQQCPLSQHLPSSISAASFLNDSCDISQAESRHGSFDEGTAEPSTCLSADELQQLVNEVSLDGGDVLEYSDFIAASMEQKTYMRDGILKAAFRVFDRDGDGRINPSELKATLGWSDVYNQDSALYGRTTELISKAAIDKEMKEILQIWDRDGDGSIGYEDFVTSIRDEDDDSEKDQNDITSPLENTNRQQVSS